MRNKVIWIGIDVGKSTCVAALDRPSIDGVWERIPVMELPILTFANTQGGVKKLLHWIQKQKTVFERETASEKSGLVIESKVVMEATGIYSRNLEKLLLAQRPELPVAIENANLIRSYRLSLNLKNETDCLDAKAIAYYGGDRQPEPSKKSGKCYLELCEMCRLRDFYSKQLWALQNMHESLESDMLQRMDTAVIKMARRKVDELTREITKYVESHDELRQEAAIMTSIPGIAILSAAIILGELGSLKDYATRNKIGAIAGLNPLIKESGTSIRRYRLSKKGSALVRKVLFMDTTTAIKGIPFLNTFYHRLISNGKSPKTAKCACMRKLLLILRSMVVNGRPYDPNYLSGENQQKGQIAS